MMSTCSWRNDIVVQKLIYVSYIGHWRLNMLFICHLTCVACLFFFFSIWQSGHVQHQGATGGHQCSYLECKMCPMRETLRCCWIMIFFFWYGHTCCFSTCQLVWVVECHLFPVWLAHFSALSLQQIDACVPLLSGYVVVVSGAHFIGGEIENRWSNFKL